MELRTLDLLKRSCRKLPVEPHRSQTLASTWAGMLPIGLALINTFALTGASLSHGRDFVRRGRLEQAVFAIGSSRTKIRGLYTPNEPF